MTTKHNFLEFLNKLYSRSKPPRFNAFGFFNKFLNPKPWRLYSAVVGIYAIVGVSATTLKLGSFGLADFLPKRLKVASIFLLISFTACQKESKPVEIGPDKLHEAAQQLSDVIVHDIFSPPVASRIYAYPSIAAYEIMVLKNKEYVSLAGQLNGLSAIPKPQQPIQHELAAVQAFLQLGRALIFSEAQMDEFIQQWHQELKDKGISEELMENSLDYAQTVTKHILAWADKDNYKQTRTFEKFNVTTVTGRWQPTPPAYMEAIEPHWNKIRPFVIDSANQFQPPLPTEFSVEKDSPFYKETLEVYETGNNLTEEQTEIASFWDCNPYVMNVNGHVMFATKKITPGGHWMGIVKIACQKDQASMMKSATAYALTSIALADGFISCWDEKYRSNLIRPETVINEHIDENWKPLLQTPPFPEYTSGHSVISGAAGIALTSVFGDNFSFGDSTEVQYGLPVRSFKSFNHASDEAAISRLYGGIHYMPAIENGITQGRKLGKFIVETIQIRKDEKLAENE